MLFHTLSHCHTYTLACNGTRIDTRDTLVIGQEILEVCNVTPYWRLYKGSKECCGINSNVEMLKTRLCKNELTIEAYGVLLQAYGGTPLAPLARGLFGWSLRTPFIRLS